VKRLQKDQYLELLRANPKEARKLGRALMSRAGSRVIQDRAFRRWRLILDRLPEEFTKWDLQEADTWGDGHCIQTMRKRGWIDLVRMVQMPSGSRYGVYRSAK
jgi:hypothetical protein